MFRMLYNADVDWVGRQAQRRKSESKRPSAEVKIKAARASAERNQAKRRNRKEKMKKTKYQDDIPRLMYKFFLEYSDSQGAPSFEKFAQCIGRTVEELESYRSRKRFDRAYRECSEIRRDYLIDRALTKRFDPSFVKFLLSEDESIEASDSALSVRLEVVDS